MFAEERCLKVGLGVTVVPAVRSKRSWSIRRCRLKLKWTLERNKKTTIAVDRAVHALIKLYAAEKGISVVEATHVLLGKAFAQEEGLDSQEKG
jgi:hypothetical protein